MVRSPCRSGLSGLGNHSLRGARGPTASTDSIGRDARGQLGLVSRRGSRHCCPDSDRGFVGARRRHRIQAPLESCLSCAHRHRLDRDSGRADLPGGGGAVAGASAPGLLTGGDLVAGRPSRAEVRWCRLASVLRRHDASMGHQSLVVHGAHVRTARHHAGGGDLCALPVAASGAPRARLASACGSLTLAQLAGGQPFWSAGTCWHGAGAGARRAGPGLISVPGQ